MVLPLNQNRKTIIGTFPNDNESTWTQLGKATGEDGKDGEDGISGDPMFTDIDYETNTDYVIFTLSNGTQIKLPTWSAFEALKTLCNQNEYQHFVFTNDCYCSAK